MTTRYVSDDGLASTDQWQLWDLSSYNNRPGKLPTARADAWQPPSQMAMTPEMCSEIRAFALANATPTRQVGGDVYPLAFIAAEDGTRYWSDVPASAGGIRWPTKALPDHLLDACISRMVEANNRWWTLDLRAWWVIAKRYVAQQPDQIGGYFRVEHGTHTDWGPTGQARKLTSSIQLSAPHEYAGGALTMTTELGRFELPNDHGTCVVFPSWTQHGVELITGGERWSLLINGFGPRLR